MDPQEFLVQVNEKCPELIKPSWVPQTSGRPDRLSILSTKFGGCSPWLSADWSWPKCKTCDRLTSFLLQINLADLPTKFKTKTRLPNGLLQIFDCTGCFKYSRRGFGSARIVPEKDLQVSSLQYLAASSCPDSEVSQLPSILQRYVEDVQDMDSHSDTKTPLQVFKEQFIGDWNRNDTLEIPHNDEWYLHEEAVESLGLDIEDIEDTDYKGILSTLDCDREIKLRGPSPGTKVGGWFDWDASLGYPGYPKCSECSGNPLKDTVFMQFSIQDLLPTAHEVTLLKERGYPDFIFVSICPICHDNPTLFESFPPPLVSQ